MSEVMTKKITTFLNELKPFDNDFQKQSYLKLQEMDFPTTKNEDWKYTRLGKISNAQFSQNFEQKERIDVSSYLISDHYLIIENGVLRKDLSNYSSSEFDISLKDISTINKEEKFNSLVNQSDIFNTLNASFFNHIIHVKTQANKTIENPLQIIFVGHSENTISNIRVWIEAEKSSSSSVIFTYVSIDETAQFDNAVTEVFVAENAHFTLHQLQVTNALNRNISTLETIQEKNSTFKVNTVILNGLLQRNTVRIAVKGENCETYMNGAIIAKGKQHIDNHTFVDHQVPNCYSNENYKYVLDDYSVGVFNGKVIVQKDAQIINAYQKNGNILLSDTASIHSKPELEIYADDVKCSHGSTTGQLDDDALFYLQTRGISLEKARKLLVSAFIGEVISSFENEDIIRLINSLLKKEYGWETIDKTHVMD